MSRWLNIALKTGAVLLALVFALFISLQISALQTKMAHKAIEALEEEYEVDIQLSSLHFSLLQVLQLEDLVVIDKEPVAEQDTLFRAKRLSLLADLSEAIKGGPIKAKFIKISDAQLCIVSEARGRSNLQRMFRLKNSGVRKEPVELFSAKRVLIENMKFRLINTFIPSPSIPGAICWSNLKVRDINAKVADVKLIGSSMSGELKELSCLEESGLEIRNIRGRANVGYGQALIEDVQICDPWSEINLEKLVFTFESALSWRDFVDEVSMDAYILPSEADSRTLGHFVPFLIGKDMLFNLHGRVSGVINSLNINELFLKTSGLDLNLTAKTYNLANQEKPLFDANIRHLDLSTARAEGLIKKFSPDFDFPLSSYAPGMRLGLKARLKGSLDRIETDFSLESEGSFDSHLIFERESGSSKFKAVIKTEQLNLGKILDKDIFGKLSASAGFEAVLSKGSSPYMKVDSLSISKLGFMGYDYGFIAANGVYKNSFVDGRLVCSDPNLNFIFQGIFSPSARKDNAVYKFFANVAHADLHALHLDSRKVSRLSVLSSANFKKVGEDVIGDIDLRDVVLTDATGSHDVGNISIASHVNDDVNRIRLDSDFATASFVGTGFVDKFIRDLKAIVFSGYTPALLKKGEKAVFEGNSYQLNLNLADTRDVLSFFMPGMYVEKDSYFRMQIQPGGQIEASARSGRLALGNKYLKGFDFKADNSSESLDLGLKIAEMSVNPVLIKNSSLNLSARGDVLSMKYLYDNESLLENKAELNLSAAMSRDSEDNLKLRGLIDNSAIYFRGDKWTITCPGFSGEEGSRRRISVDKLQISSGNQRVMLDGGWQGAGGDTLAVSVENFDVGIINPLISIPLGVQGAATGRALLISQERDQALLANLTVNDAFMNDERLGTVRLASAWNDAEEAFEIRGFTSADKSRQFDLNGLYYPQGQTLKGSVAFDSFNLGSIEPLFNFLFDSFSGELSGDVSFSGPASKLALSSDNIQLENVAVVLGYTKVPYRLSGPVSLSSEGLRFNSLLLTDTYGAAGNITGGLNWSYLQDITIDTDIDFGQMEVLKTTIEDNSDFYGSIFASGNLKATGPLNNITLDIQGNTVKEGRFHLPLSSAVATAASDLLVFEQPKQEEIIDPYEEMMSRLAVNSANQNDGLNVKLRINVDRNVESFVELDQISGNRLSGRGLGEISVDSRPSEAVFNLGGSYTLSSGNFHFEQLGIVKKDFAIQNGSSIHFNGDIMDSDLDISAVYSLKTSVGTLIADTTSTSRRTVNCGIAVDGKLRDPKVSFSIDVPDLDPITMTRVQDALSTEDKVQKQFLTLLVSGSFFPDERSGIVNNSSMIGTSVADIMANQLSSILQKLDIPLDLGLGYQSASSGKSIFDVAVSTALFDNRVIINGTIGNRQYSSAQGQEVVGDLDIDVKIDKSGSFRFNLFSHSADQYSNYLDNSQRNGIGLTYQKEFTTFGDFIRSLFMSKAKKQELEVQRQQDILNGPKTKIIIESDE